MQQAGSKPGCCCSSKCCDGERLARPTSMSTRMPRLRCFSSKPSPAMNQAEVASLLSRAPRKAGYAESAWRRLRAVHYRDIRGDLHRYRRRPPTGN